MFESPFLKNKVVFRKEPTFYEQWREFFVNLFDESFVEAIPSDEVKQMPPEYLYPVGFTLLCLVAAIFIAVFVPNYYSEINAQYLSPTESSNAKYCDDVLISNTGIYLATKNGLWQSEKGFSYAQAPYTFSVISYQSTQAEFANIMTIAYQNLVNIGQEGKNQDLARNLLRWMSFVFFDPNYLSQRFYLVGNPLNIFNRQKTAGTLSGISTDCTNNISTAYFDSPTGRLVLDYNYDVFIETPSCQGIADPALLGYTSYANPNSFQTGIDSRALITALAVNLGLLELNALQEIPSMNYPFSYNGSMYSTTAYSNPQFPNMQPVNCVKDPPPVRCVIGINQALGFPIFHHVGESLERPEPCNCSFFHEHNITNVNSNYTYYLCNSFKFITGILFYNTSDPSPMFELSLRYNLSEIVDYAYYPMYLASAWGQSSPYRDEMNAPENRTKAYEFCKSSSGLYCSFVTFSSFDLAYSTWDISPYYYQLENGACVDSFTTSWEEWNQLIETPFAPLTQGYTKCRYSTGQVLSNQAGIAVGNVSLLLPFAVILVLVAVYCYQVCSGNFIPRGYSKGEKDKALEALAICLLLAKDNKLEAMKRQYQLKKDRKETTEDDKVDSSDIEEDFSNIDLNFVHSLVNELSYVGLITREEYFRVQEENLKYESAAIDWASLYDSLRSKKNKKPGVWNNATAKTQTKSKDGEYSKGGERQQSVLSLADSSTQIELPTVSALHLKSTDSVGSISGTKKVNVLNQIPVNQKSASKYHQMTAKFPSTELVNAELDNGLREREASTASGSRGGTLTSVDLDSIQKSAHLLSAIDFSDLSEANQISAQALFPKMSSRRSRKYNMDIVQLLIKYWIPKLDNWIEDFKSLTNQSTVNSTKFWILASNTSELQLFTVITKDALRSLFLRFENQNHDSDRVITVEDVSIVLVFLTIFEKIKQLMIFHASLSMQCGVDQVEKRYDRRVGYLVGEDIWTLFELTAFIANTIDLRLSLEGQLTAISKIDDGEVSSQT